MSTFGFKLVDQQSSHHGAIIDHAIARGHAVEVGLYYGDVATLDLFAARLPQAGIPVNAHTDFHHCVVFNLHERADRLDAHIRQARDLGSAYSIIHAAVAPLTVREFLRPATLDHLVDNLLRAEDICTHHDYRLHLENTFDSIDFHRRLFEQVRRRGLRRIHFCFDIGHAKVWSHDSLAAWMDFMGELDAEGISLHCHLHANHGLMDDHLSLAEVSESARSGGDYDDGYFNPLGYPGAYWAIARRFPQAVNIFEVKSHYAIADIEAVLAAG